MYTDLNANDATGQPCDYPSCDRTDTTPVVYTYRADAPMLPAFDVIYALCPEHAA